MQSASSTERPPVIPVLVILLVALWLRLPGISAGLPYFYAEDEAHHFNRTVEMVKEGRYDPQYFHKPSLHFYLRMPVVALSYLWSASKGYLTSVREIETRNPYGLGGYAFTASHPGIVRWNRAFSVLLSLLTVLLAYSVCAEVLGKQIPALTAALLTAVSPEFLINSPIIGVDVLMSFMCLASAYAALLTFKKFSLWKLAGLGLLCGLAVSSKYNALPIAVLPFCVCLALRRFSVAELVLALLTPAAGFFLGSPFILVSIPLFLDHLSYEIWHYGVAGHEGHTEEPGVRQALFYARWIVTDGVGWTASLAAVIGFGFFKSERKQEFALFAVFPLLFAALMIGQKANFTRNMMVIIPFVAIVASCGLEIILRGFKISEAGRATAIWIAVPLLCFQPLLGSLRYIQSIRSQPESRNAAAAWLGEQGASLSDTAVSGRLLFPQAVYRLPGFSRVDAAKLSALELFNYGFSTLVVGPEHHASEEDLKILKPLKSFIGEEEMQRIVINPAIKIYSIDEESASHVLQDKTAQGLDADVVELAANDHGELSCQSASGDRLQNAGEDYCWIQKRVSLLKLPADKSLRMKLEVMSPWKDQMLRLSAGKWSVSRSMQGIEPGSWTTLGVSIPDEALRASPGILVELSQVHSPASLGINADNRRLGLALRFAH